MLQIWRSAEGCHGKYKRYIHINIKWTIRFGWLRIKRLDCCHAKEYNEERDERKRETKNFKLR